MNQTIYFRKAVWENLQDEPKKSELINNLLENHYGGETKIQLGSNFKSAEITSTVIVPTVKLKGNIAPERLSKGLCKKHGTPLDDRGRCLQKGH